MDQIARAEILLQGPRGRRVCWEVLDQRLLPTMWRLLHDDDLRTSNRVLLAEAVAACDLTALRVSTEEVGFIDLLWRTVGSARYWQEADEIDQALADDPIAAALRPVAEALLVASAARWWATPLDVDNQNWVRWLDRPPTGAPDFGNEAERLCKWASEELEHERQARVTHPADPTAPWSGVPTQREPYQGSVPLA